MKIERAFVVILSIDDMHPIPELAEDLQDDLASLGWDVINVNPWGVEGMQQPTITPPLA